MVDELNVFVARIEISKARAFANRLRIKAIPTILLFREGRTRIFGNNERSLDTLQEFLRREWRSTSPVPFYKDPLTFLGKAYGLVLGAPELMPVAYTQLKAKGVHDLAVIGIVLAGNLLRHADIFMSTRQV